MARLTRKVCVLSALLVLVTSAVNVYAESEDSNDGVTVEVEEEDQYRSPSIDSKSIYLAEHFDDESAFKKKWVKSEAKKQGVDENIAKYDGKWEIQAPSRKILRDDLGLVLTTEAKHAAISALLDRPFEFKDKPLIVQYEVTMQEGQNCGGAYIKLLSRGANTKADLRKFFDQTPYTIMFGPDKCGNDNKLHFIFRHKNPKNGTIEEKHSKKPTQRLEDIYKDKEPHLYTLVVRPDNTFSVFVDHKEVNAGSLLEDFTPPVNPPQEIDDPNDKKPEDWDEREKIVDPAATKPEDWDESAPAQVPDPAASKPAGWLDDQPDMIPDPDAQKPSDWDEDMDGEWEAPLVDNPLCTVGCGAWKPPMIPNPDYKGIWRAPLIPNPHYKGKWAPRKVPNPDYFHDDQPFRMTPIHAVGFELWSMSPALLFDNLLVTDDEAAAADWARQTFDLKRAKLSRDSDSVVERALQYLAANPWLYAVLVVVAFLVVATVAYCCCTDSKGSDELKKTDGVTEDDPHPHDDAPAPPRRKTALDADPDQHQEQEQDQQQEQEQEPEPEEVAEATPLVDTDGAGDGQRKRKPRKE
ncbi:calnexin isoform X1 [Cydia splendana]|uniref:calnexin isoform X1 n=1 Tax=Cydia splendana TaxID=1100963 RepID=UPI00300CC4EA